MSDEAPRGDDPGEGHGDSGDGLQPIGAPAGFVRSSLVFYGVVGCVALFWRMWTPGESILYPGPPPAESTALVPALVAGLVLGGISLGLSEALTRFTRVGDRLAEVLGEQLAGIGTADAVLLALASGVAEEMFFRGALQPAVGLVAASLLFGACHFLPRRELAVWSLYAVVMGLALGWLFEVTGHLIAPVAAHVLVNGVNLPRLARRAEAAGLGNDGEG